MFCSWALPFFLLTEEKSFHAASRSGSSNGSFLDLLFSSSSGFSFLSSSDFRGVLSPSNDVREGIFVVFFSEPDSSFLDNSGLG